MTAIELDSAVDHRLYELLEEFIRRLRSGKGVPVREFASWYPEYAERIQADFPALLMAEGLKPRLSMVPGSSGNMVPGDAPQLVAGYRVLRQIGQGGMGVVYEAEHPRLSRRLAVKVLLGQKAHSTVPGRFRREAEAAARLNHSNIVPVFDFGEQNSVQYLAMALIDGISLDVMLNRYRAASRSGAETRSTAGLLTLVTAASAAEVNPTKETTGTEQSYNLIGADADFRKLAGIGADIASALSHAHQNGTIHRDIKPGNLILDKAGKIWVTDFGLAKVRDDQSDLSRTGDVIGTPRFMAPEQIRGHCDERSDIYSLGITLYEMASGTRAWDSLNTAQLLKIRASADLPELADQAPFVPQALADIIMKACSYRPEDRYQSAQEIQLVLNRFAHGQKTGDRRRRPRHNASILDRRWVTASSALGIPAAVFLVMYMLNVGPWQPATLTTPEALISLVQDESQREKVVEELPDMIEAAITSRDANVREQAADLTLRVVEEAMKKSSAKNSEKTAVMKRVTEVTDEFRKTGFVYDKLQHPLTNAIRNLDLASQVSELNMSAEEKLLAHARLATVGEAIRRKMITDRQIKALLVLLPSEAQSGPSSKKVSVSRLMRFIELLNQALDSAHEKLSGEEKQLKEQLEQEVRNGNLKVPKSGSGFKIPKEIKVPGNLKTLLERPVN